METPATMSDIPPIAVVNVDICPNAVRMVSRTAFGIYHVNDCVSPVELPFDCGLHVVYLFQVLTLTITRS